MIMGMNDGANVPRGLLSLAPAPPVMLVVWVWRTSLCEITSSTSWVGNRGRGSYRMFSGDPGTVNISMAGDKPIHIHPRFTPVWVWYLIRFHRQRSKDYLGPFWSNANLHHSWIQHGSKITKSRSRPSLKIDTKSVQCGVSKSVTTWE